MLHEPLGGRGERLVQCRQPRGEHRVGPTVMHLVGGHQPDPGMVMLLVVPVVDPTAEVSRLFDAGEPLWERSADTSLS